MAEAGIESKLGGKWSLRVAGKAVYYGESQALEDEDLLLTAGFGYNHLAADYEVLWSQGSRESLRMRVDGLLLLFWEEEPPGVTANRVRSAAD